MSRMTTSPLTPPTMTLWWRFLTQGLQNEFKANDFGSDWSANYFHALCGYRTIINKPRWERRWHQRATNSIRTFCFIGLLRHYASVLLIDISFFPIFPFVCLPCAPAGALWSVSADNITAAVSSERMLEPLASSKHGKINGVFLLISVSVGVSLWFCHPAAGHEGHSEITKTWKLKCLLTFCSPVANQFVRKRDKKSRPGSLRLCII